MPCVIGNEVALSLLPVAKDHLSRATKFAVWTEQFVLLWQYPKYVHHGTHAMGVCVVRQQTWKPPSRESSVQTQPNRFQRSAWQSSQTRLDPSHHLVSATAVDKAGAAIAEGSLQRPEYSPLGKHFADENTKRCHRCTIVAYKEKSKGLAFLLFCGWLLKSTGGQ